MSSITYGVEKLVEKITNLGINLSEGDTSAMGLLQSLLERVADNYQPDDFGDPTTDNIYELLAETSDSNRFQFNLTTLSRHLYGIGAGEFMIAMARPETGKTTFLVSLCAGPGGFCEQGAKVLILGNEERTTRTKLRAIQSCAGMTRSEIADNPDLATSRYLRVRDNLIMKDVQEWDLDRISNYCRMIKPDVLIVDQADKVGVLRAVQQFT